jgi:ribonuclease T2
MKISVVIALGLFAASPPAFAQALQCRVPAQLDLPAPLSQDEPTIRSAIGGYPLAISWSPEFCGFILHGLWPEAQSGAAPQWCSPPLPVSPQTYRDNLCMTPSPWLLQHEWAKHGTCMARDPAHYYQAAAILWRSLRLPDPSRIRSAGEMRAAFAASNPAFTRGGVGLVMGNGGWLRELHLCYGADFMPATCRRDALGPPDTAVLKVARRR